MGHQGGATLSARLRAAAGTGQLPPPLNTRLTCCRLPDPAVGPPSGSNSPATPCSPPVCSLACLYLRAGIEPGTDSVYI